ncbi:signal peptide peptidase SppA [Azospirillum thermophilum]|uniref:Signal peptide peptidase SppA n=1 Tax=Azospirillum thermophilum TaxID=2202148 RepID=A0A2S2CMD3_9PROT|nr:signal peptide peptidase SppA [Azospirillum thermophilum]AWK85641.1 signal peptide peptidase SppA [Azospirillum thermophilum]
MLRFFVRLFAFIGFLIVALVVAGVVVAVRYKPTLPDTMVLELDLTEPLSEGATDALGGFLGHEASLRDVLDALERGRRDPRVKGLLVRFGSDRLGFAQAQELRAAVSRFRDSGRFAVAYAEGFGEGGAGNRAYLLASAFDEVWMQPLGLLGVTGLSAQVPFARAALDQLGVDPQLMQREEYKSFAETFTRTDFTPAHREMMEALLRNLTDQMVNGIAASRRLAPAAVRAAIDRSPLLDREALEAKLIDRIGYADEAKDAALRRATGAELVDLADYRSIAGPANSSGPTVALIHAVGTITGGKSERPGLGDVTAGSETIVEAIEEAVEDPDVRAILFRIDSGGGSVSASEAIRRALVKAREKGKPVIASMGDTAASGGYWIALAADKIVASPATLTGSIGVVAGKMAAGGLSEKLGVHWGEVKASRNAGMWSPLRPFSASEEERMTAIIDRSYATFLERVAEARRMSPEQAREVAKGRVWTGEQAREIGLVDALGGEDEALSLARQAIGLAADAAVTLTPYPPPKSLLEQVAELMSGRGELVEAAAAMAELRPLLARLAPLVDAARSGGLQTVMPPVGLSR